MAPQRPPLPLSLLRAMRPRQWVKNLVVFAALIFSLRLTDPEAFGRAALAFVLFCATSGAVYIVNDLFDANRLRTAVHLANRRVFREAENHDDYTGMGTTIVAALVMGGTVSIAHVGDSRMYHAVNGQLEQLTRDDSWAATVLGQSPLDGAKPAEQHPMRHVLTNVLGARDNTEIHLQERQVGANELLLLCTDGLHGSLPDAQIKELLQVQSSMERTAEALVRAALDRGCRDNVTALVAVCEE